MRVALCVDSLHVGGTELNAVRVAERLPALGIDVVLLTLRRDGPLLDRCRQARIRVVTFPIPPLGSWRSPARGLALIRLLRRLRVDLVHAQDRYSNAFVVPWARFGGVNVLASRRWGDIHPSRALGLANRLAYRMAHGVVANSARVAELVTRVEGVAPHKVFVVSNFLDEASLSPACVDDRLALRAQLKVPAAALVIGSVANLRPVKDHRTLLEAVARLVPTRPDLVLCLVGDGDLRVDLEQQARRLGITSNLVFAGSRSTSTNWHAAFDVSALTSLSEGFPNTVIEAMAAGCPIVATHVGGTPDAVRDGETGFLVPPDSPEPLASALARLLGDPGLRVRMGNAGRSDALERFSAAAVLPKLVTLYRTQAVRRPLGPPRRQ